MKRAPKTAVANDPELKRPAKCATKGMKPGVGSRDKQNPKMQRSRKIEAWCEGKSGSYK